MQKVNPNDVRLAAMNLLARREHLRAELAAKLRKRFDEPAVIDATLQDLVDTGLLSDERFTESYIHHRSLKGYGPDRIRQELRQKGAGAELVELAFEATDADWVELARGVREKKFGPEQPPDFREKSRQLRFLNYRGFSGEFASLVFEVR